MTGWEKAMLLLAVCLVVSGSPGSATERHLAAGLAKGDNWSSGSQAGRGGERQTAVRRSDSDLDVALTTDSSDNSAPVFSRDGYVVSLEENAAPDSEVVRVTAHDADSGLNGLLHYFLEPRDDMLFNLHSDTGLLTTRRPLDREVFRQINLRVVAVDSGQPRLTATALLVVVIADVNDNAPQLLTSELRVGEGRGERLVGRLRAYDNDVGLNGTVVFSLLPASPPPPFTLSRDGQLFTASHAHLDRDSQHAYTLHVLLTDKGTPPLSSSATVTVHVGG